MAAKFLKAYKFIKEVPEEIQLVIIDGKLDEVIVFISTAELDSIRDLMESEVMDWENPLTAHITSENVIIDVLPVLQDMTDNGFFEPEELLDIFTEHNLKSAGCGQDIEEIKKIVLKGLVY